MAARSGPGSLHQSNSARASSRAGSAGPRSSWSMTTSAPAPSASTLPGWRSRWHRTRRCGSAGVTSSSRSGNSADALGEPGRPWRIGRGRRHQLLDGRRSLVPGVGRATRQARWSSGSSAGGGGRTGRRPRSAWMVRPGPRVGHRASRRPAASCRPARARAIGPPCRRGAWAPGPPRSPPGPRTRPRPRSPRVMEGRRVPP